MKNIFNSKTLAYAGFGLALLGLLIPYIHVYQSGGLGLLVNARALGMYNGFLYTATVIAVFVAAYAGFVTFKRRKDAVKAGVAAAVAFVVLLAGYYILKKTGVYAPFIGMFFKLGAATWMFMLASVCYFIAARVPD